MDQVCTPQSWTVVYPLGTASQSHMEESCTSSKAVASKAVAVVRAESDPSGPSGPSSPSKRGLVHSFPPWLLMLVGDTA